MVVHRGLEEVVVVRRDLEEEEEAFHVQVEAVVDHYVQSLDEAQPQLALR